MEFEPETSSEGNECRLIIVDDDSAIRLAIRSLLNGTPAEVIGEAEDGSAGVDLAQQLHPDIVLLDVSMPRMNGFAACRELRKRMPELRIIFLSENTQQAYVDEALEIGANAYVTKRKATHDLLNAIRTVLTGHTFISGSIAGIST